MGNTPSLHIAATEDDIANTVLMPGDPLRSKFIAENFLENAVLVNNVRGVQGYTGYYKGKRVTVMASGMGQPSMGIYSYELFKFFDVDNIIRIGTCATYRPEIHVRDLIIAQGSCTDSYFANQFNLQGNFSPIADFGLLRKAVEVCEKRGTRFFVGNILSSDVFYEETPSIDRWGKMGVLGVEMESAALYTNAARLGKKALCICTVSDSFVNPKENATTEERQVAFTEMMEVALETA